MRSGEENQHPQIHGRQSQPVWAAQVLHCRKHVRTHEITRGAGLKINITAKMNFWEISSFLFFFLLQPFDVTYRRTWYRITSYQHSIYFLKITCWNCADECQQESTKTMRWKNLSASSPQHLLLLHIPVLFCWDRRQHLFHPPKRANNDNIFLVLV